MKNKISKIALGSAQFGLDYGINNKSGKVEYAEVLAILKYFSGKGLKIIDTAYGYGNSEEIIGRVSEEMNLKFDIVTKIPICDIYESASIFLCSLKRLNVPQVYGCLLHDFNFFKKNSDFFLKFIDERKKESLIKKWGVSVYAPDQVEYLLDNKIDFDIIQLPYNILDRRFEYLFSDLSARGIEIHCRSVFLQGLFYLSPDELPEKLAPFKKYLTLLKQYSEKKKISLTEMALSFVINHDFINTIIIGVNSLDHLKQNIGIVENMTDGNTIEDLPRVIVLENELLLPSNWT